MNPIDERQLHLTRRRFFGRSATGMGIAALHGLLRSESGGMAPQITHLAPKAKRVIVLFQSGGPSQQDLFDPKPRLQRYHGVDLRDHLDMNERVTGMTKEQERFPIARTNFQFRQHGQSGAWISELLPYTASIADELCFVKSMQTDHINHDPAVTFFQTGFQLAGRPSLGSWLSYGLGSVNADLPAFIAMVSRGSGRPNCQPLFDRLWGSGFLPTEHSGVRFMSTGDPVLYLKNPNGFSRDRRRKWLDKVAAMNELHAKDFADPQIEARIKAYEMAFRMQTSIPELTDISDEPESVLEMYGDSVRKRGSYAYNCLLARRLAERDVRCVQLFHMGWDQHFTLPEQLPGQCQDTDQPSSALVRDLKARGMLEDTLVVWGGEFGRTSYCQGKLTDSDYGRDHHPRCFTIWMAGGGIQPGMSYGATDDYSYNVVKDPAHIHDLHATMLHLMGVDHRRLTHRFQGRQFRLTDVHGRLVKGILT